MLGIAGVPHAARFVLVRVLGRGGSMGARVLRPPQATLPSHGPARLPGLRAAHCLPRALRHGPPATYPLPRDVRSGEACVQQPIPARGVLIPTCRVGNFLKSLKGAVKQFFSF